MTELEWLKQESGMTDEEMKAMETVAGAGKFKAFLMKAVAANNQAATDKQTAESERLALEKRYQDEFIPEMRKVTQDSLRAQGEAAAAQAALKAAREYGIVPDEVKPPTPPGEVRAPGSPDPAASAEQFKQWSQAQSRAIVTLNDLNAEHFKLFKEPLPNSQELVNEVERQHTLGHKDFSLKSAWETKFNVPAKRTEIQAAEIQKGKDEYAELKLKEYKQTHPGSSHPGMVSGQSSRFATYKPADANAGSEPWKTPAGMKKSANQPWRDKAISKVAAA
jgi:hypothetical protein